MRTESTIFLAGLSVLAVLAGPPRALAAEAASDTADIPRTASGRPDLSGNYDLASLTPMQRNAKYGDRRFLTKEEAEAIEKAAAEGMARADSASDPNREAPAAGGDGSGGAAGGVGGYNAFWVDPGTKIYSLDGKYLASIISDPPDGRVPPMTEEGKARRDKLNPYFYENNKDVWWLDKEVGPYDGPESLSLLDRCLYVSVASLPPQPVLYNNLKTITQTDTHVVILVEWMHWARVIRLDSKHLPPEIRSLGGDSIGHWEGDTLVVDTTNFLERPNVPRDGLHVVERFSRVDHDTLRYQFTVEDPEFTKPWSGEFPWEQTTDRLYEYACHEGNYALGNILRGARLMEKEALAKRAAAQSGQ